MFISENTILNKKNIGEGSHTVTVLEKRSSSYHKEVQRIAYRQRTGKCLLPEREEVQIMSWWYSWVVSLLPIPLSDIRH